MDKVIDHLIVSATLPRNEVPIITAKPKHSQYKILAKLGRLEYVLGIAILGVSVFVVLEAFKIGI